MKDTETMKREAAPGTGSYGSYAIGFIGSLALTLGAYFAVTEKWLDGTALIGLLMVLAVTQLVVQLVFFLHLGRESSPKWNLVAFIFMLIFLAIIVFGSIWIMDNLNYNMMMTPEQMDAYMKAENAKGF